MGMGTKTGFAAFAVFSVSMACCAEPAMPSLTYQVHMQAKPAVVRVFDGYTVQVKYPNGQKDSQRMISTGSGFFVSADGYILTNAHVVSRSKAGPEAALNEVKLRTLRTFAKNLGIPVTKESLQRLHADAVRQGVEWDVTAKLNMVLLQDGTALRYDIKSIGDPIDEGSSNFQGKDVAVLKVEMRNAPTLQLADSGKVHVGDRVYVLGYPAAADSEALNKSAIVEPTTNEGAISALKTSRDGIPIFQTNASATHGNSGGPVVNDKGEVIGLLTFGGNRVNDQEIQGFNFVVPSVTAREFVVSSGAVAAPGVVDQRWREGLGHFWQGHYRKAKANFEEVTILFPAHVEAKRLIADAQERILNDEDRGDQTERVLQVIGASLVIIGMAAIGFLVMRKRRASHQSVHATVGAGQPVTAPRSHPAALQTDATAVSRRSASVADETLVALPRNGPLRITFVEGPLRDQRAEIPAAGAYLGRDVAKSNLVVAHQEVSGRHLWLGQKDGGWWVIDQNSTNGTFVNDFNQGRVTQKMLRPGDRIIMGPEGVVSFVVG